MLHIHSLGHFHPENVIDNAFLESLDIGTSDEWIRERVGIRERRTVLPLDYLKQTHNRDPREANAAAVYSNAQTGARAAKMAVERAGLKLEDIGMVISGCSGPQWSAPAEACTIAAELGLAVPCLDINSACSSYGAQLYLLSGMRPDALPTFILLVNPENNTRVVNYADRAGCVLWGDATTATVVSTREPGRAHVAFSAFNSDPSGWNKVIVPTGGHFSQDGKAVQGFAIRRAVSTLEEVRRHTTGDPAKLYFITHQANLLMLQAVGTRGAIEAGRHYYNVETFGNTASAGAPSVLSQRWDDFRPGDELALVVVGSGLTWAGMLIQFDEKPL